MKQSLTPIALSLLAALLAGCNASVTPPSSTGSDANSSATAMENTSDTQEETSPMTAEDKIDNAMSAGPALIATEATVLDWPATATGDLSELRKGTNGWTCLPNYPGSPGNDPLCVDAKAMEWFKAYMSKKEPKMTQAGIGYMLQGGSDASNTDPFAEKPAPGEDWMTAPPHIMVFSAGKLDPKVYGTEMNGGPWIMWAGTPYEHLMIPVE